MPEKPFAPRIVLFGIGLVGQALTRIATDKGWPIVAAFNRAGEKVGQDLGRVAGLDRDLGVVIQDSETSDFSDLDADVALIAATDRLEINFPAYEKFFKAGINVLCHGTEAYNPRWINPEMTDRIDKLAKECGVTFTGSGIWDMTRLWSGILVAGPCVEIESLVHTSNTEIARQGVQYFPMMGVDMTVEEYDEKVGRDAGPIGGLFHIPGCTVLEELGYTVTNHEVRREPIVWDEPIYVKEIDKELAPGTSLGTRLIADVHTEEGVSAHCEIEYRVFRENEEEEMRWVVKGKPGMEIRVLREDSGMASASSLFNRIPDVMAAEPGVVELTRLGPERPSAPL